MIDESATLIAKRLLDNPENRICEAAANYLKRLGWRVVAEVPFWERSIDIVGTKDG